MSKALKDMTVGELSLYMKDNHKEWQKAYKLFVEQCQWQEVLEGVTWE